MRCFDISRTDKKTASNVNNDAIMYEICTG